jgi:hypothetical protein
MTRAIAALLCALALLGGGCAGLERRPEGPQAFVVDVAEFSFSCLANGGVLVAINVTKDGVVINGACLRVEPPPPPPQRGRAS